MANDRSILEVLRFPCLPSESKKTLGHNLEMDDKFRADSRQMEDRLLSALLQRRQDRQATSTMWPRSVSPAAVYPVDEAELEKMQNHRGNDFPLLADLVNPPDFATQQGQFLHKRLAQQGKTRAPIENSPYSRSFQSSAGIFSSPNTHPAYSFHRSQRTPWPVSPCEMPRSPEHKINYQHAHLSRIDEQQIHCSLKNNQYLKNPSEDRSFEGFGSIHDDARLLLEAASKAATQLTNSPVTEVSQSVSEDQSFIGSASDAKYADFVDGSVFTTPDLFGTVPDSLYISMAQMKLCRLRAEDRFGNYKHRDIGFVGMACRHCGGLPGFGRHFPGSFQSLLSGSHCVRIVKHMRNECRACPERLRSILQELEVIEKISTSMPPDHGSRKRFVAHVWAELRNFQSDISEDTEDRSFHHSSIDYTPNIPSEEGLQEESSQEAWEMFVRDSELVSMKDRHLVPDATLFAIAQMKPWPLTHEDQIGRHKDKHLGFVGMCCRHCGGKAGRPRYGRYFPSSIKTLAKPASCERLANHLASECPSCPMQVREVVQTLQIKELAGGIRYGSRNIFFQRVWNRLHHDDRTLGSSCLPSTEKGNGCETTEEDQLSESAAVRWDLLLRGSPLVTHSDRGAIPDAQLAAIAQLEPCLLMEEDKVGWYKHRPISFGGLACRFCKGRPGFGRYFPNTLRTFSQNNYSQIVGNHLSKDCQEVPKDLKAALLTILQQEGPRHSKKSSYAKGSRKAFYDRIWDLIHSHSFARNKTAVDQQPGKRSLLNDCASPPASEVPECKRFRSV